MVRCKISSGSQTSAPNHGAGGDAATAKTCIIVGYDIFGFQNANTRANVDVRSPPATQFDLERETPRGGVSSAVSRVWRRTPRALELSICIGESRMMMHASCRYSRGRSSLEHAEKKKKTEKTQILAERSGFLVVLPDFYRGASAATLPELTGPAIGEFVTTHGGYERVACDLKTTLLPLLRAAGVDTFFWLGFCWGGMMALSLAADRELGCEFAAVGGVHASFRSDALQLGAQVTTPVLFIQAGNDPDIAPLHKVLCANEQLASKHLVRTYFDMTHGFCSARGDRSNKRLAAAVQSTLQTCVEFFNESK